MMHRQSKIKVLVSRHCKANGGLKLYTSTSLFTLTDLAQIWLRCGRILCLEFVQISIFVRLLVKQVRV